MKTNPLTVQITPSVSARALAGEAGFVEQAIHGAKACQPGKGSVRRQTAPARRNSQREKADQGVG